MYEFFFFYFFRNSFLKIYRSSLGLNLKLLNTTKVYASEQRLKIYAYATRNSKEISKPYRSSNTYRAPDISCIVLFFKFNSTDKSLHLENDIVRISVYYCL